MTGTDKAIRWSTAAVVIGVAVVAAVVSVGYDRRGPNYQVVTAAVSVAPMTGG